MDLSKIKKLWNTYCDDFENSEEMDIDKHTSMALKIGRLIQEIERLKHLNEELSGCLEWHIQTNERYEKALKEIVDLSPSWSATESYTNSVRIAVKALKE